MNKGTDRNILTELNITSNEYNLVTVLYTVSGLSSAVVLIDANHFQVPYIVAEIPSNLLLKKFRPSRWQSRIMLSWCVKLDLYATEKMLTRFQRGIVTACTAAVYNTAGLYACRFLLGLVRCS